MEIKAKNNYEKNPQGIHLEYIHDVVYSKMNDQELKLQIIRPYSCNFRDKFPCLLYVQGSGFDKQPLYSALPDLSLIAKKGFVVALVEYRAFCDAAFPAMIIDVKNAFKFLFNNSKEFSIDEKNIFLSGNSSGGYSALFAYLTIGNPYFENDDYSTIKENIRGIIDFYAPIDLVNCGLNLNSDDPLRNNVIKAFGGEEMLSSSEYLKMINPINFLHEEMVPFLILHGTADPLVDISESDNLYHEIIKRNCDACFIKLLESGHGGPEFFEEDIISIIVDFMNKLCI